MKTDYHYEVIGWNDADKNNEAYHANCTTIREARRIAKALRGRFDLLTIDRVIVDADDPNNYIGFETIAEYVRL